MVSQCLSYVATRRQIIARFGILLKVTVMFSLAKSMKSVVFVLRQRKNRK